MAQGNEPDPVLREKPMGELFKELSSDLSMLVRQELQLARAEMTEKGKQAGFGVGMFGGAGIVGLLAAGTLSACVIAALALAMSVWLAALIVTVVYLAVAGVLALVAKKRVSRATPPVPEQTVETVKEDVQWAKTQLPSGSK
ncbi:MAG: phage holin family protein [Solirubrobacterales bacterium]|nr:phage holin family protein [Solirubrobacterales bacterium]